MATAIAPLLGGWIVDHFSWRWLFLANLPAGEFLIEINATDGDAKTTELVAFRITA